MAVALAVVAPSSATPSGYDLVEGTATDTNLDGYPAQVVYETPIDEGNCQVMTFTRPSRIMVRIYLIEDTALAGSGLGVGQYIRDVVGVDNHDYGLLWIGSQIDHDGNTAPDNIFANWRPRGFSGSDVYNASSLIKFGVNPDTGNFSWWEWENADTWRDGSPVPDGYSPYVSWKSQDEWSRAIRPSHLRILAAPTPTATRSTTSTRQQGAKQRPTATTTAYPTKSPLGAKRTRTATTTA